jgi:hypothetical protein
LKKSFEDIAASPNKKSQVSFKINKNYAYQLLGWYERISLIEISESVAREITTYGIDIDYFNSILTENVTALLDGRVILDGEEIFEFTEESFKPKEIEKVPNKGGWLLCKHDFGKISSHPAYSTEPLCKSKFKTKSKILDYNGYHLNYNIVDYDNKNKFEIDYCLPKGAYEFIISPTGKLNYIDVDSNHIPNILSEPCLF